MQFRSIRFFMFDIGSLGVLNFQRYVNDSLWDVIPIQAIYWQVLRSIDSDICPLSQWIDEFSVSCMLPLAMILAFSLRCSILASRT
jgi:hypothetical protein